MPNEFAALPECKIEGCTTYVAGRGLCASHYAKYRSNGWLDVIGDAPRIVRDGTVANRGHKVVQKLYENMAMMSDNRPDEFMDLIRSLGYFVTAVPERPNRF